MKEMARRIDSKFSLTEQGECDRRQQLVYESREEQQCGKRKLGLIADSRNASAGRNRPLREAPSR
jgi:hypothetical protein